MADPKECGHDMGGIWVPHPKGGEHYYCRIFCNKPEGHEKLNGFYRTHGFLDPKGGMLVTQALEPRVVVTKDRIGPPS